METRKTKMGVSEKMMVEKKERARAKPVRSGHRNPRNYSHDELALGAAVAAEIQRRRIERGMTQAELAEKVGVGAPMQSRRESSDFVLAIPDLQRYAKALGCFARDLLPEK
jgi:ribosome-binding protein aMBF1 (putative translation factor)